ncbi:transcriptional regulator, TetR family [Gottschalkia acidurici 9a]|uniref:Transcriptional regulator, TetR family n=1 Tax=Gottschalkia acidurici (strain ATCC 7906 / DSM 604 / BCRC 14475 / CIP 104303 / KCTC 5404 / NCIMB 10678 / 9a) TaxID=1128398 RepID=K0AY40_GOTA9|nr:TetR/AcrR family transcriptional regulator [Gottschalkia acidurici]AFS77687.1 transcriptional regulator, TetR family [Gottschalkia acidurici 9a]
MPKSTFFNLSEEKKERILEAAIDEFAENPYESASINKIVKNSEIAKGSFYQYFEDKKDLFKYLIEICETERVRYIEEVNQNKSYLNHFRIMRECYKANIKFFIEKPKLSSIINKFSKNTDSNLKKEILEDLSLENNYSFESILKEGVDKGSIYYNVDIEFISYLLENIGFIIKEYAKDKKKKDGYVNYDSIIDSAIDLIENGIKDKKEVVGV